MSEIIIKSDGQNWRLYVRSLIGDMAAGTRLNHGGKFPLTEFIFRERTAALAAAKELMRYLNGERKLSAKLEKQHALQAKLEAWNAAGT